MKKIAEMVVEEHLEGTSILREDDLERLLTEAITHDNVINPLIKTDDKHQSLPHLRGISSDFKKQYLVKSRYTARAIILSKNLSSVLMLYSSQLNDYTFVGGGIKKGESKIATLRREVLEEMGAIITKIRGMFGYIDELREGIYKETSDQYLFFQRSFYFFISTIEVTTKKLEQREIANGLEPKWVLIEDAIAHNKKIIQDLINSKSKIRTTLVRETRVLEALKHWKEDLKSSKNIKTKK